MQGKTIYLSLGHYCILCTILALSQFKCWNSTLVLRNFIIDIHDVASILFFQLLELFWPVILSCSNSDTYF